MNIYLVRHGEIEWNNEHDPKQDARLYRVNGSSMLFCDRG
jgi:broad specificity phosphatase PhoE